MVRNSRYVVILLDPSKLNRQLNIRISLCCTILVKEADNGQISWFSVGAVTLAPLHTLPIINKFPRFYGDLLIALSSISTNNILYYFI